MLKLVFASLLIVPIAFGQIALTTAQIAKRVSPAVVVIQGKTDSGNVVGSGFIISTDGKIVTNLHVIRDMNTAQVHLANGETFDSISSTATIPPPKSFVYDGMTVLAIDEGKDLAIIQISGHNLTPLDMGNSDALSVGEPLVIVGSPRGLEGTVTAGILSSVRDSGDGFKVLQTDASVNPGNSGGPLLNNKGQAIGVVSFKLRSAEGLNFAIPINYVRGLLNNLHEPMTLAQMRRSLVAATSAVEQNNGPSLKETLDWLKQKIPLTTVSYVHSSVGKDGHTTTTSRSEQGTAMSFESCTVAFGSVEVEKTTEPRDLGSTHSVQFTVPLGILTTGYVDRIESLFSMHDEIFVSGDKWFYVVYLKSKSAELSQRVSFDSRHWEPTAESVDTAFLKFNDESVARRVVEAFHHAAEFCRKKEVF